MNRLRANRLTLLVSATVFAVAALVTAALVRPTGTEPTARGAEAELFLLTTDSEIARLSPELGLARMIEQPSDLEAAVSGPAVIIVDRSAVSLLSPGALRPYASNGYALVGVNVPLDELSHLAGFTAEIAAVNPRFGEEPPRNAVFRGDFFTVVWRTPETAETQRWTRLQQDLTPALFSTVIADMRLLSAGLARDDAGNIVPIEEY